MVGGRGRAMLPGGVAWHDTSRRQGKSNEGV